MKENPGLVAQHQIPVQSTAPKRNGMALPAELQKRIADMARSGLYANPSQIGKALRTGGISISDNAVRDNLERAGLYGFPKDKGKNGKPKRKVILR